MEGRNNSIQTCCDCHYCHVLLVDGDAFCLEVSDVLGWHPYFSKVHKYEEVENFLFDIAPGDELRCRNMKDPWGRLLIVINTNDTEITIVSLGKNAKDATDDISLRRAYSPSISEFKNLGNGASVVIFQEIIFPSWMTNVIRSSEMALD